MEQVLAEWDRFARTLELEGLLSRREVRDHAEQILRAIALDIDTHQSAEQQQRKSQGLSPENIVASGASIHGTARQHDGFTLLQLTAEFRALRATVQRLWFALGNALTPAHSADLIRFNEAIDQALAESVATYAAQAARAKDTFLAILGHDLRNPLATIALSSSLLGQPGMTKEGIALLAPRVKRSASMMNSMINDLLEYARAELGGKMPMAFADADMLDICHSAVIDASAVHSQCTFVVDAKEPVLGCFDQVRLQQVFTNLLNNAAQYRGDEMPVTMTLSSDADSATISIQNSGALIPKEAIDAIFDPMVQLAIVPQQRQRATTSLGLGLYIAKKITEAHDGSIGVESRDSTGTTFTVVIPKARPRH
ncbi:HAMP domain-containing histidine kinase [Herbaspirillum sp. 3R11]|nr:sensor histidine kinase [Herbaspirillum sp. 3R-3a1]TFI06639.1 HAMP domain-containing histidine kinase [Herbaspirillum sp. 3R11]TFI14367.1 HAMP domain-containing histidine kinase [Herbaspirillum sp. 3R-11]TFI29874.1 HAMP domain-containing histidine kinase [Herbaspirillum sp. 3C11]